MTVDDFEVTITKYPRDGEEEGSVVLLGNRSKEEWLRKMRFGEYIGGGIGIVMDLLDDLARLGIHTDIESIELSIRGGPVVSISRNKNGEFGYRVVHEKEGSNG